MDTVIPVRWLSMPVDVPTAAEIVNAEMLSHWFVGPAVDSGEPLISDLIAEEMLAYVEVTHSQQQLRRADAVRLDRALRCALSHPHAEALRATARQLSASRSAAEDNGWRVHSLVLQALSVVPESGAGTPESGAGAPESGAVAPGSGTVAIHLSRL